MKRKRSLTEAHRNHIRCAARSLDFKSKEYEHKRRLRDSDGDFTKAEVMPAKAPASIVGQSSFVDFDGDGYQDHLLPACLDSACQRSAIYLAKPGSQEWVPVLSDFQQRETVWSFVPGNLSQPLALHLGDYNLDGFPDALVILRNTSGSGQQAFLLENVPCNNVSCHSVGRMFHIHWDQSDLGAIQNAVIATFFDIYEDGILDMLVLSQAPGKNDLIIHALKNNFEADAYFVKVMVITFLVVNILHMFRVAFHRAEYADCNHPVQISFCPEHVTAKTQDIPVSLGWRLRKDVGLVELSQVLSGLCSNRCPEDVKRHSVQKYRYFTKYSDCFTCFTRMQLDTICAKAKGLKSGQLSQSAHFSLQLPYTLLGLGRSANFLDHLFVGIPRTPGETNMRMQEWTAIIPNSQLIVIPYPHNQPRSWSAKLHLTPSNSVLLTAIVLIGVCVFILVIIGILHWKEK
ncbi:hypothetical protein F2P81_004900, partial [Scophthalmus maximus]